MPRPAASPWRLLAASSALALALALSGCGTSSSDDAPDADAASGAASGAATGASDAPPAASQTPSPGGSADAPVPAALDFTATTVTGESFSGASVAGRPVVLWFWAPWCAVCRSQVPQVQDLVATFGDEVAVVGVGSLDSGSAIQSFAAAADGPTHLSDPDGALWRRFSISEQSSFVVLDAAGEEVLRTGYNDDDAVADTVRDLAG